jgi:hypothetical protein
MLVPIAGATQRVPVLGDGSSDILHRGRHYTKSSVELFA